MKNNYSIQALHYILDFFEVDPKKLNDTTLCRKIIEDACRVAGCTILDIMEHKFDPHGLTIACILSESHCTLHTWPESSYCAIDIYGCGEANLKKAVDHFINTLTPGKHIVKLIKRGEENA